MDEYFNERDSVACTLDEHDGSSEDHMIQAAYALAKGLFYASIMVAVVAAILGFLFAIARYAFIFGSSF